MTDLNILNEEELQLSHEEKKESDILTASNFEQIFSMVRLVYLNIKTASWTRPEDVIWRFDRVVYARQVVADVLDHNISEEKVKLKQEILEFIDTELMSIRDRYDNLRAFW